MTEVKLGMRVKDKITGFTGIVVTIESFLGRCDQAVVQPPIDKEGKVPDAVGIDVSRLEVTSKKQVIATEVPEPKYEYGQEVTDNISELKGKIIARAVHISGCVQVALQPKHVEKREKLFQGVWVPESQITAVGKVLKKEVERPRTGSVTRTQFQSNVGRSR